MFAKVDDPPNGKPGALRNGRAPRRSIHTRVGRNMLGVFVVCALLPVIGFAVLSEIQVASELQHQSREQLQRRSRADAEGIGDRMRLIGHLLEVRARMMASARRADVTLERIEEPPPGLLELEVASDEPVGETGGLTPPMRAWLADGHGLLMRGPTTGELWMGTMIPGQQRVLWGMVDADFLFALQERRRTSPSHELCVLDAADQPLLCTSPAHPADLPERDHLGASTGSFQWVAGGQTYLGGIWPLTEAREFGSDPWHVVASQNRAAMLAPAQAFQKRFRLMGGLAVLVVLYASARLIRRNMDPLARLKEGTKRLAERDFDHRVVIAALGQDEFSELAASFNGMAERLGRHERELTAGHAIDRAMLSSLDRHQIVEVLLERGRELLPCEAMAIGQTGRDGATGDVWTFSARNGPGGRREDREIRLAPDERSALERGDPLVAGPGTDAPAWTGQIPVSAPGIRQWHVVPIRIGGKVSGALVLGSREMAAPTPAEQARARLLADRVAVAFTNASLVEELGHLHWGTLTALARAIDAKSPWTAGHSERVTTLAHALATELAMSPEDLDRIHRGGLLHDIGKIGIPAEVLDKPSKLSMTERHVMETHPVIGVRILAPIAAYADVLDIVRHHHERWDGLGYPDRLTGEAIPVLARVLAVADVFDALTSARPYRPGLEVEKALAEIRAGAGTAFDPRIAAAFLRMMETEGADTPRLASVISRPSLVLPAAS